MSNKKHLVPVVGSVALLLGLSGVAAVAVTSSTPTTYYACLQGGDLSKVGTVAPQCGKNQTPISWNNVGPTGPAGADGKDGAPGEPGVNGTDGVDGKDGVNGQDGAPGQPGAAGQDGAPGPAGPPGLDALGKPPVACDTLAADSANPTSEPLDMYLTLDGVPGGATDKGHEGAIPVTSFCMGGANAADAGVFTVEKPLDGTSVPLLEALAGGDSIPTGEVMLVRPSAGGAPVPVATYKFSEVTVRGYRLGGHEGTDEDVSFAFGAGTAQSFSQAPDGDPVGSTVQVLGAPDTIGAESKPRCAAVTTDAAPNPDTGLDLTLNIPGIAGTSTNKWSDQQIELQAICFGGTAGPAYTSVTASKSLDLASAPLQAAFTTGTSLGTSTITWWRPSGNAAPVAALTLALTTPTIDAYRVGGRGGSTHEDLSFVAASTVVTYRGQNPVTGAALDPQAVTLTR